MTPNLHRIRKLAGLILEDQPYILSQDDADDYDDRADDERHKREQRIVSHIAKAFARIGIAIANHDSSGIFYDETDREATVQLDDSVIEVARLIHLQRTGLADDYRVQIGTDHALDIVFTVSAVLDRAV